MDDNKADYCRLCAELKSFDKMLAKPTEELISKVEKLNIQYLDFEDPNLPKSVCIVCSYNVDSVVNILESIEKAQSTLKTIFSTNMKGEIDDDEDTSFYQPLSYWKSSERGREAKLASLDKKIPEEHCNDINITTNELDIELKVNSNSDVSWNSFCWLCAECETQFSTCQELVSHSMTYHNKCSSFKCIYCNKRRITYSRFVDHVSEHSDKVTHTCFECLESFEYGKDYDNHIKTHANSPYKCAGCNTKFDEKKQLIEHQKIYFNDKRVFKSSKKKQSDQSLTCSTCNKTLGTRCALKTHQQVHKENRRREYVCDKCGKSYLSKNCLQDHFLSHQAGRHTCMICKVSLKTLSNLRKHVLSHETAKPFSCEKCGKSFRLLKSLTSHAIVHSDVLPHICPYCNKGFKFKHLWKQHQRQHTGVRPYKCDLCDRPFTNWPNYNKHMNRKHGINMAKRKRTAEAGFLPINPVTGDVEPPSATSEEWKKNVMKLKKRGARPKTKT